MLSQIGCQHRAHLPEKYWRQIGSVFVQVERYHRQGTLVSLRLDQLTCEVGK